MISDKARIVLLVVLVLILFANWQFFLPIYYALQDFNRELLTSVQGVLPSSIVQNEKLMTEIIPKGISYVLVMLINIAISLSIIAVYFRDRKITIQAVKMIGLYFIVGFTAMNICYFAGWHEYFLSARYALNLLASPLVECSMIPILKLANSEMNQVSDS